MDVLVERNDYILSGYSLRRDDGQSGQKKTQVGASEKTQICPLVKRVYVPWSMSVAII